MSKKKLKLGERISLGSILPGEGKFEELIIREDINKKIEITQKELEKHKIRTLDNGMIAWSAEANELDFSYSFTDKEEKMIKDSLTKLSESGKLQVGHMELYKAFVK